MEVSQNLVVQNESKSERFSMEKNAVIFLVKLKDVNCQIINTSKVWDFKRSEKCPKIIVFFVAYFSVTLARFARSTSLMLWLATQKTTSFIKIDYHTCLPKILIYRPSHIILHVFQSRRSCRASGIAQFLQ